MPMSMLRIPERLAPAAAVCCVFAHAAAAAPGNMIGRQTQNEGFDAVPAPGPVAIDADFSDWDFSGRIESYADSAAKDTHSVRTAAMWDRDNLYLAFDWRDPTPLNSAVNPEHDPTRGWQADAVQLRLWAGAQLSWVTMWGYEHGAKPAFDLVRSSSDTSFKAGGEGTALLYTGRPGDPELGQGVALAYRETDDGAGFRQEVRIPWAVVYAADHAAAVGEVFQMGLEFLWANATGTGFPEHRYIDNLQPGKTSREFFWTAIDSWGDVRLAPGPVKTRTYVEGTLAPQGHIPLRLSVPVDAQTFSVVLDDPAGRRVRNVAGGLRVADFAVGPASGGTVPVEVRWDGLDEDGLPAAPGRYRLSGIVAGAIDGYWESCFYNPGHPAWSTADKTGGWGADHTVVHRLARSGDRIVVACSFAEGGYGTFCLRADGTKVWSEIRGTDALAANSRHVFLVPNDWGSTGESMLRLDAATGAFAPFPGNPVLPVPLADFLRTDGKQAAPRVLALAADDRRLAVACSDNTLRLFDPDTGAALSSRPFHLSAFGPAFDQVPFALDGDAVYSFFGRELLRTDLATGHARAISLDPVPADPRALAVDGDGNLLVADAGPDSQIKVHAPDGRLLRRIGKTGGRPREGAFEADGMREMSAIAVDADGAVWTTEKSRSPRRLSKWAPDGRFLRDFIGNTGYAGGGTLIHSDDPDKAYAELNELRRDPATGEWRMAGVLFNPDPAGGLVVRPGHTSFHDGNVFHSAASGERHEYYASLGEARNTPFAILVRDGDRWAPVAAITSVGTLLGLVGGQYNAQILGAPTGEFAGCDPSDVLLWNDLDNDGRLTRAECEILPARRSTVPRGGRTTNISSALELVPCANTAVDPADLSFYATRLAPDGRTRTMARVAPVGYRDGGRPVYALRGVADYDCDFLVDGAANAVPGKNLTVGFIRQGESVYVAGWRTSSGELLWRYLSPYHQVHGSHKAPMPRPGLLIGCLKIMGVATSCGDSDVLMVRGNLGEDYFLTADGCFVGTLTRDGRLPGIARPEGEEAMRKVSFSTLPGRGEHFSGVFTRHSDGVVRCSGGLPAEQAGNILRIEGLHTIRHVPAVEVSFTAEQLAPPAASATADGPAPLRAAFLAPGASSPVWDAVPAFAIERGGQPVRADVRLAWDPEALHVRFDVSGDPSPWVNRGNDWHLLFKTGDCVELQLAGGTVPDGLRLLFAPFGDGQAAVLLRRHAPGAAPSDRFTYTSPVMTVPFDLVRRLDTVAPTVQRRPGATTLVARVPWSALGLAAPARGDVFRADAGFILSDPTGTFDTARVYRFDKQTNLVNDQPGEAVYDASRWGELRFE